jgi:hypothetical protein
VSNDWATIDKNKVGAGGLLSGDESKLKLMEEMKRRKISIINLSYSNTLIITG